MSNTPFKMKGWSPFTKKSPAKHDEDPHAEHHEMTGTLNKDETKVINEKGNWVGVGDRPDLTKVKNDQEKVI